MEEAKLRQIERVRYVLYRCWRVNYATNLQQNFPPNHIQNIRECVSFAVFKWFKCFTREKLEKLFDNIQISLEQKIGGVKNKGWVEYFD